MKTARRTERFELWHTFVSSVALLFALNLLGAGLNLLPRSNGAALLTGVAMVVAFGGASIFLGWEILCQARLWFLSRR